MAIVKLRDIVDAMDMTFDTMTYYLSKKTGEVVSIGDEEMDAAENEDDLQDFLDWQHDNIEIAREILATDDYVALPSQFDIHEYDIMERFCLSINDDKVSDDLYADIKGRGAFRRFKDKIFEHGIEQDWYQYKDDAYCEKARDWCIENSIEFTEEVSRMSYSNDDGADDAFEKMIGKWIHLDPYDSDDYLAVYEISGTTDDPIVKGHDKQDGEKFDITNIKWDGYILEFESLMLSTGRKGINKFKLLDDGIVESEFTFTVIERMKKEKT